MGVHFHHGSWRADARLGSAKVDPRISHGILSNKRRVAFVQAHRLMIHNVLFSGRGEADASRIATAHARSLRDTGSVVGNHRQWATLPSYSEVASGHVERSYVQSVGRPALFSTPLSDGRGLWAYVLRELDGDRVKIGCSSRRSPLARIRQHLTSSSQGRQLVVVAVLRGAPDIEATLHQRFEEQRAPGKREWFVCRGPLEVAVIDRFRSVAAAIDADWHGPTSGFQLPDVGAPR